MTLSTAKISTTKDFFHIQATRPGDSSLPSKIQKCTGAENERDGRISAAVTWNEIFGSAWRMLEPGNHNHKGPKDNNNKLEQKKNLAY